MPPPADITANGDIFGGSIVAHVDLAGAVLSSRMAGILSGEPKHGLMLALCLSPASVQAGAQWSSRGHGAIKHHTLAWTMTPAGP